MRGKVLYFSQNGLETGITPAGAGKRSRVSEERRPREDHPRGCGEKPDKDGDRREIRGSPPRVRGKGPAIHGDGVRRGITPAGAGKSFIAGHIPVKIRDHPRGCGEKAIRDLESFQQVGSPPRVRGKVLHLLEFLEHLRITPAGAGKSRLQRRSHQKPQDHPRGCGEKTKRIPILGRFLLAAVQISFSFK